MPKNTKSKKRSIYKPKNSHRVSSKRVYKYFSNLLKGGDAGAVQAENTGAVKLPLADADIDTEENANAVKENDKIDTTLAGVINGATTAAQQSAKEFFSSSKPDGESDEESDKKPELDVESDEESDKESDKESEPLPVPDYKEPDNELMNKLLDEKDVTIEEQKSHIMDLQLHVTDLKQIINGQLGTNANDNTQEKEFMQQDNLLPGSNEEDSLLGDASLSAPEDSLLGPASVSASEDSLLGPASVSAPEDSLLGPASVSASEGSLPGSTSLSAPEESLRGSTSVSASKDSLLGPVSASASEPMVKGGHTSNNRRKHRVTKRKNHKYKYRYVY